MEPAALWAAVAVVIFAGASFFFALAETALFSLGKWQARQLTEQNPRGGGLTPCVLLVAVRSGFKLALCSLSRA